MDSLYKQKYIKYKFKYNEMKKQMNTQLGGECNDKDGNPTIPDEDYQDPIQLSNLHEFKPNERITVNGNCYNINDIYKYIITDNHDIDPHRKSVSNNDKQRITNAYNLNNPIINKKERQSILNNVRQFGLTKCTRTI